MTTETSRGWSAQIAANEVDAIKMRQEIDRLEAEVKARDVVINSLKATIKSRDVWISSLNDHIDKIYRKISHGCTDANCKECDR